jgi:hypothetical protein
MYFIDAKIIVPIHTNWDIICPDTQNDRCLHVKKNKVSCIYE